MARVRSAYNHLTGQWEYFPDEASDAPRGTSHEAKKKQPRPETVNLQGVVEQMEVLGGRIGAIFGTTSPEAAQHKRLWQMLRHDLDVMEQQDIAA